MDFEIIENELKMERVRPTCFHCGTNTETEYTYAMLKNTYYCNKCFDELPNFNSAIDNKFNDSEKKINELTEGMVDKNKRIRDLETKLNNLEEQFYMLVEFIENYKDDKKD